MAKVGRDSKGRLKKGYTIKNGRTVKASSSRKKKKKGFF